MSDESNTLDLTEVPDNVEQQEETEVVEEVVDDEESEEEQVEEEEQAEQPEEEEQVEEQEEQSEEEQVEEEESEAEQPEEEEEESEEEEQAEQPEEEEEEQAEQPEEAEEEEEEQVEEEQSEEQADQPEQSSVTPFVTDNLCSLKTLVDVLGKWSGGEIRRRNVEELLKEGSEVDENLDDLEKVVEVLQLWIGEGGSTFREHNHFKNLDEYTLVGESRNLSEEKKIKVLKTLTELVVNVSQRKVTDGEIQNVMNNLY
tara:strand:- start:279 stop:1049 length:771 start_codon:yes stop_codon:yes gene_type:complete